MYKYFTTGREVAHQFVRSPTIRSLHRWGFASPALRMPSFPYWVGNRRASQLSLMVGSKLIYSFIIFQFRGMKRNRSCHAGTYFTNYRHFMWTQTFKLLSSVAGACTQATQLYDIHTHSQVDKLKFRKIGSFQRMIKSMCLMKFGEGSIRITGDRSRLRSFQPLLRKAFKKFMAENAEFFQSAQKSETKRLFVRETEWTPDEAR